MPLPQLVYSLLNRTAAKLACSPIQASITTEQKGYNTMEFSNQTTNLITAIKNLPPDIVAQDSLNIGVHQNLEKGKEYIVIWVSGGVRQ